MPELFREAGYLTAGFTGGGYLSTLWGFPRGFGTYFMFPQPDKKTAKCPPERFDGGEVFSRGTDWLRRHAGAPFFLFLHTYDVHDRCPFLPAGFKARRDWPDPGDERRRELMQYYDNLIAGADKRLGALLHEIDELEIADTTLVVVTSDHGEGFWEHGFFGHGRFRPYEELLRVPLVLRLPGRVGSGKRVDEPVSLVDLAPTILALTGVSPPARLEGRALPGLGLPRTGGPGRVYAQCDDRLAVRSGPYKLITSKSREFPDEVYDLIKDPGETRNLLGNDPTIDADLRRYAADYWRTAPSEAGDAPPPAEIDEKTRQRLRALGYLDTQ